MPHRREVLCFQYKAARNPFDCRSTSIDGSSCRLVGPLRHTLLPSKHRHRCCDISTPHCGRTASTLSAGRTDADIER